MSEFPTPCCPLLVTNKLVCMPAEEAIQGGFACVRQATGDTQAYQSREQRAIWVGRKMSTKDGFACVHQATGGRYPSILTTFISRHLGWRRRSQPRQFTRLRQVTGGTSACQSQF